MSTIGATARKKRRARRVVPRCKQRSSARASSAATVSRGGLSAARQLAGHELVGYDTGPYAGPGFEWLPEAAQQARLAFSANDALPLRDAARAGLGLTVLPHFLGDETRGLTRIEGGGEGVVDLWIVTREEQKGVPAARMWLCLPRRAGPPVNERGLE
jgi:DNA-binding transcriptional LysR family regulator